MDTPTLPCCWIGCPNGADVGVVTAAGTAWLCCTHCAAVRRYAEQKHGGDLNRAAERSAALRIPQEVVA